MVLAVCTVSDMSDLSSEFLALNFDCTDARLGFLQRLLAQHDIFKVADLACIGCLKDIPDFALLPASELNTLERICDRQTSHWRNNHASLSKDRVAVSDRGPDTVRCVRDQVNLGSGFVIDNKGLGPQAAAKRLKVVLTNDVDQRAWVEKARITALLGSSAKSHGSFLSGVRCYVNFADSVLHLRGREFPPSLKGLLAWSTLFRCGATFSNYLGHVRLACELLCVPSAVIDDPSVKRAKRSIDKRGQFVPRKRLFLRMGIVKELVIGILSYPAWETAAMLFLTCYVFLLRLPSEALPIVVNSGGALDGQQSTICVESDVVVLYLARRKNKPQGSVLKRHCWCSSCAVTCPVHVLGTYLKSAGDGAQPFVGFSAGGALSCLRGLLEFLKVPDANIYRTHDLRRGHARDLQANGATLATILAAGDWRSPAFLKYLDEQQLEDDAVVEAHLGDSSFDET